MGRSLFPPSLSLLALCSSIPLFFSPLLRSDANGFSRNLGNRFLQPSPTDLP
ncbi:hypothetical protein M431DRAFT_502618 [Trichoderma harzianum CBS 226.95]|uniref:Uncharacterized protein n=1 Tax=Trichoderma harzianum CBS 226.95 TaxID=983964 RepID=A0A2T4ATV9_TRIHA|nr:hypothetical protein M431DRAFT_502618 [Trichoderma harzianum CBS 226.95]PTB60481.1 hypothetical protein M431DRAFT_502618 [Trichoderma harzianum CBS 226.95]